MLYDTIRQISVCFLCVFIYIVQFDAQTYLEMRFPHLGGMSRPVLIYKAMVTKKGKFRKDLATTKIRFLHAQLKTNANRDKTNFGARRCTMLIRLEEKSKPFAEICLIFRKNRNIFRMFNIFSIELSLGLIFLKNIN